MHFPWLEVAQNYAIGLHFLVYTVNYVTSNKVNLQNLYFVTKHTFEVLLSQNYLVWRMQFFLCDEINDVGKVFTARKEYK